MAVFKRKLSNPGGGIAQADRACVLTERHIEAQVQAVLDPPVGTDGVQDATTVSGEN